MSAREQKTFDIGEMLAGFGIAWLDDGDSEYCEQQRRLCLESMAALDIDLMDIKRQIDEARSAVVSDGSYILYSLAGFC